MSGMPPSSARSGPGRTAASRALELFAEAAGGRIHRAPLRAAGVPPAPTPADAPAWLASTLEGAHGLGLRATRSLATVREVLKGARDGHPFLTADAGGETWWLVAGDAAKRPTLTTVRTVEGGGFEEESAPVDLDGLTAALGGDGESAREWVRADPLTVQGSGGGGGKGGDKPSNLARVWRLLAPERADLMVVAVFAATIGVLNLATPIAVQAIVNSIAMGGLLQPLLVVSVLLAFALLFSGTLTAIQTWVVELVQRRIFIRAVADVAARLTRVSPEAYAQGHGREFVNRFFDVLTVQKAVSKLTLDALGVVLGVVVGLAVLAFYHPILLVFDIILLLAIGVLVLGPIQRGQNTAMKESTAKYAVVAWLEELAGSPHAFKAFGADQWVLQRSDELARGWLNARRSHFRVLLGQISGALLLKVIASAALLGVGGLLVIQGSLTLGQLVAAELIVSSVVEAVAKLGRYLEQWYDLTAGSYKLGQLLDLPLEPEGGEQPPPSPERGARLELDGVCLADGRGRPVLSNCSVEVLPGERLAVVGPSGSGKSALLELLWRMHDPDEGAIRLDGRDYRDLVVDVIRRDVALVTSVEVIHGTIRENVSLFRPFVSADDVRTAIQRVGLEDAISELPRGMDTVIHPSTRILSKGELEQLMLARAIAGTPRLLVIDGLFDRIAEPARTRLLGTALLDDSRDCTLVLVTADEELAARCEHVLRLETEASSTGPAGAGA